jgi:hypothetical protein
MSGLFHGTLPLILNYVIAIFIIWKIFVFLMILAIDQPFFSRSQESSSTDSAEVTADEAGASKTATGTRGGPGSGEEEGIKWILLCISVYLRVDFTFRDGIVISKPSQGLVHRFLLKENLPRVREGRL